jgi:hypothetical protein
MKIVEKLQADVVTTVLTNNGVWIPAQLINLGLVPPQYQVLFANFVGLFWNTYLSAVTYRKKIVIEEETAVTSSTLSSSSPSPTSLPPSTDSSKES